MKKINKGLKRATIILVVISIILMCFIGTGMVVNTYALEKPIVENIKVGVKIIENVDLAKDFRAEKEINLNEIQPVQATVIEEPVELTIEERIRLACEDYDVPFDIALAIARLETGWFKSKAYVEGNNPGGLSRNEKPMSFDTIEDGVEAFISNLANNYIAEGLDTPKEIGKKYCPVNPKWASIVEELMTYEP